jgi:predicted murein hydrolase (TIGR00659 family)
MSPDWQGAWQALLEHPLFGFALTLGAYQLALALYEKTRWVLLQPVLLSILLVIGCLLLLGIEFETYRASSELLTLLLGPATVALAVPLYLNLRRIRQLLVPVLLTLACGAVLATALGVGLGWLLGLDGELLRSLAAKSATTPIAMLVTEQIGGIAALAAVFVMVTGVLGGICGPELLRLIGVRHPAAVGMALGINAHAVGTSRAIVEGEECGAFAALGMSLTGAAIALFLPLATALLV